MDLDEMKSVWEKMGDQMEQTNILNNAIIEEMITQRKDNALEQLKKSHITFIILLSIVIVLRICMHILIFHCIRLAGGFIGVCIILCLLWEIYKLHFLNKINLSGPFKQQIERINKYEHFYKYETIYFAFILISFTVLIITADVSFLAKVLNFIGLLLGAITGIAIYTEFIQVKIDKFKNTNK